MKRVEDNEKEKGRTKPSKDVRRGEKRREKKCNEEDNVKA